MCSGCCPTRVSGGQVAKATTAAHGQSYVYTERVFEWDPRKAQANAAKHGVTFDEAITVFLDANALDGPDLQHSGTEARSRRLGMSLGKRILTIAYTLRKAGHVETIRIISARRASGRERQAYGPQD